MPTPSRRAPREPLGRFLDTRRAGWTYNKVVRPLLLWEGVVIRKLVLLSAVVGAAAGTGVSQEGAAKAAPDFVRDVLPLLKEHCWSCHGPAKQKGGLRLDLRNRAFAGGAAGPAF